MGIKNHIEWWQSWLSSSNWRAVLPFRALLNPVPLSLDYKSGRPQYVLPCVGCLLGNVRAATHVIPLFGRVGRILHGTVFSRQWQYTRSSRGAQIARTPYSHCLTVLAVSEMLSDTSDIQLQGRKTTQHHGKI